MDHARGISLILTSLGALVGGNYFPIMRKSHQTYLGIDVGEYSC
jgi:hypothetical protein